MPDLTPKYVYSFIVYQWMCTEYCIDVEFVLIIKMYQNNNNKYIKHIFIEEITFKVIIRVNPMSGNLI